MQNLNASEIDQVNGGFLFIVVPVGYCLLAVATELAIIAAIATSP